MKRKVLLFGATGKTGAHVCKQLELNSIPSSVFVREASAAKLNSEKVEIIKGDVLNKEDVEAAFQANNYTDIIIALGDKSLRKSIVRSGGTQNIIEAMKLNPSGGKLHIVSALGVGDSWKQLKWHAKLLSNLVLKSVMEDHQKQEEMVMASSYPYHIIRPVGLTDKNATGKVHVQPTGFLPQSYITRADVAKYIVDAMIEDKTGTSSICQVK